MTLTTTMSAIVAGWVVEDVLPEPDGSATAPSISADVDCTLRLYCVADALAAGSAFPDVRATCSAVGCGLRVMLQRWRHSSEPRATSSGIWRRVSKGDRGSGVVDSYHGRETGDLLYTNITERGGDDIRRQTKVCRIE